MRPVLFALFVASALSLQFYVPVDSTKCLAQEVQEGELVIVDYFIFKENWHSSGDVTKTMDITVKVNDPRGTEKLSKASADEAGKFTFKAEISGDYDVCFVNKALESAAGQDRGSMKRKVAVHFKVGIEAKDYSQIAKKENLRPLEVEIRKVLDRATEVNKMVEEMKEREEKMRDLNEETNARVLWFSLASITVLVLLGAWQVYELKRFFIKKKLI